MSRRLNPAEVEENELLETPGSTEHSHGPSSFQTPALGVPRISRRLWLTDGVLVLTTFVLFGLACTTVFDPTVAARLGQVRQLIVLGVFLQLMGLCTQKHIRYFLLVIECLWNRSSLQNFESIIQWNFLAPGTSLVMRIAIMMCLVLPLGLGAAYKTFTGGETTLSGMTDTGSYGMTGPPGTVGIGSMGIGLFFNATLLWWNDPVSTGAYGFNLNVESNSRTALLDGPTVEHVAYLRSMLREDETMLISTSVNATVAEMVIDLTDPSRNDDLAFWLNNSTVASLPPNQAVDEWYAIHTSDSEITVDAGGHLKFDMCIPQNEWGWIYNNTFLMTSRWNGSDHETFGSAAQGYNLFRQKYNAAWSISPSTISLVSASQIPDTTWTDNGTDILIGDNYLFMQTIYPRIFVEYDWKYLGGWTSLLPDQATSIQRQHIKSDTTTVAAMLWSRVSSYEGLANSFYNESIRDAFTASYAGGLRYEADATYRIRTPTLKNSFLLVVVLAVHPVIVLVTLLIRLIFLNDAPLSEGFGFAALLAGIEPQTLALVKGASYSGKLKSNVAIRFSVSSHLKHDQIQHSDYNEEASSVASSRRRDTVTMRLVSSKRDHFSRSKAFRNDATKNGVLYE